MIKRFLSIIWLLAVDLIVHSSIHWVDANGYSLANGNKVPLGKTMLFKFMFNHIIYKKKHKMNPV